MFKDNGKLKLLIIVGTRPEIIRLAEVINKCRQYFDTVLAHTGQNYDYNLNGIFFRDLGLEDPDVYMMNQEMERVYEKCRAAFPEYFKEREANAQRNITRNDFSLVPPEGFILPKSSDVSIQSRRGCDNDWLCGTLGIMFQNEVYRRRCRHRRCHRWW